jgi:ADP-L-glycero-D-manno-heptose 6-epimerase
MIVVTGGAGFIGSNIVAALTSDRSRIVAVCDVLGDGGKWRNLAKHTVADIVPPDALFELLGDHGGGVEAVVHMGAVTSTAETDTDWILENNFRLSLDLWDWCTKAGVPLIYASSAATYGDGSLGFGDSNDSADLAKLRPLNAYGWSKHLFDCRAVALAESAESRPPQWAGLKFFNVYGPNEYHKGRMRSVALQVFERASSGEAMRLFRSHHPDYADGGQLRDFVYVADCVDVVLWLLENPAVSGLFNLGTGTARSFADLAGAVFAALGQTPAIEYIETPEDIREKYQYFTEARMERLRDAGFDRPFTSLEDGAIRYVQEFLATSDPYR